MMIKDRMIILVEAQHRFFTLHNLKLSHFLPISKLLQSNKLATSNCPDFKVQSKTLFVILPGEHK